MPTKKNAAGHDQPYVPMGNPTGGEYADNETGSNKNYKSEKLRDRERQKKPEPDKRENRFENGIDRGFDIDRLRERWKRISEEKPTVSSRMERCKSLPKEYHEAWKDGNKDSKAIIENIAKRIGFRKDERKSAFLQNFGTVVLEEPSGTFEESCDGGKPTDTLFHELGHAVDWYMSGDKNDYGKPMPISWSYKTEATGRTLWQTLTLEMTNDKIDEIQRDFMEEWTKLQKGGTVNEVTRHKVLWSDMSDIFEGATGGFRGNLGYGHGTNYWAGMEGQLLRGTEFFAECFSAKSSANPERYNLIRKYLPKSCKAFDEIYEKLKEGKKI